MIRRFFVLVLSCIFLGLGLHFLISSTPTAFQEPEKEGKVWTSEEAILPLEEEKPWSGSLSQEESVFLNTELNLSPEQENLSFKIPVLMFHYIQDIPANTRDQLGYRLSYAPQKLDELLTFFEEQGITTLTFWDLKAILEGKQKEPEKAVILAFDDGHADHYSNAYPVLKKHGAKAVFFIISGKPDQDPKFANRAQVKELADAGFEIGSHSISHRNLTSLGTSALIEELSGSKAVLEAKIWKPVISFCYPAGRFNAKVLKEVQKHYLFARTTQPGAVLQLKKRRQFPTVRISPTTTSKQLAKYRNL